MLFEILETKIIQRYITIKKTNRLSFVYNYNITLIKTLELELSIYIEFT